MCLWCQWVIIYRFSTMKYKGFTLLELLVVIGIIGVLMALATVAYSSAQISGRNARRKQDLVAIQNALEQYYSANAFKYPAGTCSTGASIYLKSSWPVDPLSTATTIIPYSGVGSCTTTSYCICSAMEGSKGGNSAVLTCESWIKDGANYCVSNLQ